MLPLSSTTPDERLAIGDGLADAMKALADIMLRIVVEKPGSMDTMAYLSESVGEVVNKLRNIRSDLRAMEAEHGSRVSRMLDEIEGIGA